MKSTLKKLHNKYSYYSLPALEEQKIAKIHRLPLTIRIMLESLLRNCNGKSVKEEDVINLANWSPKGKRESEVPFVVSRVLLQDFTGVPLVVDLAAMRDCVRDQKFDPKMIEPQVPVDLVVDHSVQVDRFGSLDAYDFNLKVEFERNRERYAFLKWGENAFETFSVVPPGIGICHQVNLEHLAEVVIEKDSLLYFDTLVGTDSHTTMINGLGIVGWGVGGIEAEAAMLGQPVTLQMPEVVGFSLSGALREGVTATDLALRITQILRQENVVDKFVEFFGEGVAALTVADRATIANMSPEYGATMGFFPIDEQTLAYLRMTGRDEKKIALIRDYMEAQGLFGVHTKEDLDFTKVIELDLATVTPSVSGPKRPQDRIALGDLKKQFEDLLKSNSAAGYAKKPEELDIKVLVTGIRPVIDATSKENGGIQQIPPGAPTDMDEMVSNRPFTTPPKVVSHPNSYSGELTHGSVVIAAITSCTNTSNPSVMIGAGLLAKKAVEKGLKVNPLVKTSLAPGSRVVTEYLEKTGLQKYLNLLGFQLVGYGCTTCIGNSGPLDEPIENAIKDNDLVAASVLSGNRNFEARIHGSVKANFLMSPPLVVAFAIAGRVDINLEKEPLGYDKDGKPIFLYQIWPTSQEIQKLISECVLPSMFKKRYANILEDNPIWKQFQVSSAACYPWDLQSSYIQKPPYFEEFSLSLPKRKELHGMRCLALLGDSVTTDHISPAGAFKPDSPAGKYLLSLGIPEKDFNSYGSRRGNHHVMMRGTFANVRIKNKMAGGKEGGFTKFIPDGPTMPIYDACMEYAKAGTPLLLFAGKDYGMGSSRDWAAKGTALLGVRAVIAQSFERIHRSNLIGMGVLPLQFKEGESYESHGITGEEEFTLKGLEGPLKTHMEATLEVSGKKKISLIVRIDTPIEIEYFQHGGIMPYVLRQIIRNE